MTKAPNKPSSRHGSPRQGSIYIAVSGTAMLVSLIGFTALHLSRLELRTTNAQNDRAYARQLAQSGVEFALAKIDLDSSWRTNFSHGVENVISPLGLDANLIFKLLDNADSDLADDATEPVEIQGIGRYGGATFIYSVDYAASVTSSSQVGPLILQSYEGVPASNFAINKWNYTGQHFIASLPAEAITWDVLSAEIYVQQSGGGTGNTLYVKFYTSDGSGQPATLLETVAVLESDLPASSDWHSIIFSSVTALTPGQGLCLALEGASQTNNVCNVAYDTGVTQTDTHRLVGSSTSWSTPRASESILYRIHCVYNTAAGGSGEFTVTPGSWRTPAAP